MGTVLLILCFFPLIVFFVGYCVCVQPKTQQGKTPNGTAWCSCCAVFWVVCVFGMFLTAGWGWIIGSFLMMIPFCMDSCYAGAVGGQQTTIIVQNTASPMVPHGMMMQAPMQAPMQMQPMQMQPMQMQPMQMQPVMASAVPYQPPVLAQTTVMMK